MVSKTKSIYPRSVIEQLVIHHFPKHQVYELQELGDGMQNAAWLVTFKASEICTDCLQDARVVLKIGAASDADLLTYEKDNLVAEVHALQELRNAGVPVPKVLASDFSKELIDNYYFFMEYVPGKTWNKCLKEVSEENRKKLIRSLGCYAAMIHSVQGQRFGYVRNDSCLQSDSWGEAFTTMMKAILDDGRVRNYELPYKEIEALVEHHRELLDEIKTPRLVDYDLWAGNVLLNAPNCDTITGIIDLGNCFYGDPYAEFVGAVHLYENVEDEAEFIEGYSEVAGEPLVVTEKDRARMQLYRLYLDVIVYVEAYRYEDGWRKAVQKSMGKKIRERLDYESRNFVCR